MTVTSKKKIFIVVYFKMAPQIDNRVKDSALLLVGHKVSKVANLSGCLAQPPTQSRSAWMMAKVSTNVQEVVERLLGIVTACGMPFEGLLVKL